MSHYNVTLDNNNVTLYNNNGTLYNTLYNNSNHDKRRSYNTTDIFWFGVRPCLHMRTLNHQVCTLDHQLFALPSVATLNHQFCASIIIIIIL